MPDRRALLIDYIAWLDMEQRLAAVGEPRSSSPMNGAIFERCGG